MRPSAAHGVYDAAPLHEDVRQVAFRVVAVNLPGYGETTPQPSEQEPDVGYASELVEALIRHVGPPAVLAGHSYGGVVVLAVALRGNVRVEAVVLFEPVAMKVLAMANEVDAFATAKAVFDDYISRRTRLHEQGKQRERPR